MGVFLRVALRRIQIRLSRRPTLFRALFFIYLGFLVFFSVTGERSLATSYQLWKTCQHLDAEIETLQVDISKLRRDVNLYRKDLRTIERFAREELHLAGDNEIHYIFR